MCHKLGVTLEELYVGKTKKIAANRDIACEACQGKGGTRVAQCLECKVLNMRKHSISLLHK